MALVNGASCAVWTYRNSCKFFSESDEKNLGCGYLKNSGERSRAILALLLTLSLSFCLESHIKYE